MNESLAFKKVGMEDRNFIVAATKPLERFLSCEYSFFNLMVWGEMFDVEWTLWRGVPLIRVGRDDVCLFPLLDGISSGDLHGLSERLRSKGFSGSFVQVPQVFLDANPDVDEFFEPRANRDCADYIHSLERLVELRGTKLRKKRAFVKRFKEDNAGVEVVDLEPVLFRECWELAERNMDGTETSMDELGALKRAFEFFGEFGGDGIAVLLNGDVVAFSIFSRHLDGTCLVNFEKADRSFPGLAQFVNWATATKLRSLDVCEFLNREQDLGVPGLRKAKKSYDPDIILENHDLTPLGR